MPAGPLARPVVFAGGRRQADALATLSRSEMKPRQVYEFRTTGRTYRAEMVDPRGASAWSAPPATACRTANCAKRSCWARWRARVGHVVRHHGPGQSRFGNRTGRRGSRPAQSISDARRDGHLARRAITAVRPDLQSTRPSRPVRYRRPRGVLPRRKATTGKATKLRANTLDNFSAPRPRLLGMPACLFRSSGRPGHFARTLGVGERPQAVRGPIGGQDLDAEASTAGLYADRTVGGDCHHRHPHYALVAGGASLREAARRTQCSNNIKQLCWAV